MLSLLNEPLPSLTGLIGDGLGNGLGMGLGTFEVYAGGLDIVIGDNTPRGYWAISMSCRSSILALILRPRPSVGESERGLGAILLASVTKP